MPKDKTETKKDESPKAVSFVGKKPAGTPGPEVNMPCQRGKDLKTKGQACDSKRAFNISPQQGGKQATFRCVKCNHTWSVAMGGSFAGP